MIQKYLLESAPGAVATINGSECNYFGGTSYYELHKNPDVIDAAINALRKYGINSASSRTSYGTTPLILEIEKESAVFFDREDSVYLSSGFLTDMAAAEVLEKLNLFDRIFIDEISHYSNDYAAKLSSKPIHDFKHADAEDLRKKITELLLPGEKPLIVTDGIFPIFGNIAPINEYLRLAEQYDGIVWTDDAHAIGIIGDNGRGTFEHYGLRSDRLYFGGTMSKAMGGFGGIIPGSLEFIGEIKKGHVQSGCTPPPSAAVAAGLEGMKILKSDPGLRTKLWNNAKRLKSGLQKIGITVSDSNVPIAAWHMDKPEDMARIQTELMKKNFCIQLINYVGAGESGALRIVVFSTHTNEQIDSLISELRKII